MLVLVLCSGSHGTLLGIINAFVHVIMYSYYFLTSYRPELRNSLWWKKHITQIQLVSIWKLKIWNYQFKCLKCHGLWSLWIKFPFYVYISDPIWHFSFTFYESDIFSWLCMAEGDIIHWCYSELVYVYIVSWFLYQSIRSQN